MAQTRNSSFAQTNAFAMQNALWLGAYGAVVFLLYLNSVNRPLLNALTQWLVLASPLVALLLNVQFRRTVAGTEAPFAFGRSFAHCALMGVYASFVVAVAVGLYFAYLDGGAFYASLISWTEQPDNAKVLDEMVAAGVLDNAFASLGVSTVAELLEPFKDLTGGTWAGWVMTTSFLLNWPISVVVGLLTMRGARRPLPKQSSEPYK